MRSLACLLFGVGDRAAARETTHQVHGAATNARRLRLKELRRLIKENSRNADYAAVLGLILQIAGYIVGRSMLDADAAPLSPGRLSLTCVLLGIGSLVFIYGSCEYAMAKGLPGALGLLGIFGILGLGVIVLLRDESGRRKDSEADLQVSEAALELSDGITIRVVFFGELRERTGVEKAEIVIPPGITVGAALEIVADQFPAVRLLIRKAKCSVNFNAANRLTPLDDRDELALVPAATS